MKVTNIGYFYNRTATYVVPVIKRITYASFALILGVNASYAETKQNSNSLNLQNQVQSTQQKQKVIKGIVTDETGETLPGVSVAVVGETSGTITDVDGKFTIKVNDKTKQLSFSYIGMKTKVVDVNNK
ncbi:carboxypeptidase-like regulatory domain-containing protein, partial [Prolixibacteraceae bacterium]|nr:carboxypeptidase-like regulatory domain-containing protein [Prolixibacteraceae bacterium]